MSDVFSASAQEADTHRVADAAVVSGQAFGRFGHHPDHIIDYSVEVECVQSMVEDYCLTGQAYGDDDQPVTLDDLMRRIWKANSFRVSVVPEALSARRALVSCISKMEPIYVAALSDKLGGAGQ